MKTLQLSEAQTGGIIGVSMRNSHFSRANIQSTTEVVRDDYGKIFYMLPDNPGVHTLRGFGYEAEEAQRVVKKNFGTLRNHCRYSIEALGLENAEILRWEQFEQEVTYQEMLRAIQALYSSDLKFKQTARSVTQGVYEHSRASKKELSLDQQIDLGVHFLLEELAFILASPDILHLERAEYLYHRAMPILTDLLAGKFDFVPPQNVGFRQLSAE